MSISRSEEGFTDRIAHAASNLEANTNLASCTSTATYVIMEFGSCAACSYVARNPEASSADFVKGRESIRMTFEVTILACHEFLP